MRNEPTMTGEKEKKACNIYEMVYSTCVVRCVRAHVLYMYVCMRVCVRACVRAKKIKCKRQKVKHGNDKEIRKRKKAGEEGENGEDSEGTTYQKCSII